MSRKSKSQENGGEHKAGGGIKQMERKTHKTDGRENFIDISV